MQCSCLGSVHATRKPVTPLDDEIMHSTKARLSLRYNQSRATNHTRGKRSWQDPSKNAARRRLFTLLGNIQVPHRYGDFQLLHDTRCAKSGAGETQRTLTWFVVSVKTRNLLLLLFRERQGVWSRGVAATYADAHLLVEHPIGQLLRAFPVRALYDPVRLLLRYILPSVQILGRRVCAPAV